MSGKHKLIIVCKTYTKDLQKFRKMFDSYQKHNIDDIPLYVSVPERDIKEFSVIVEDRAQLLSDESYAADYFADKEVFGLPVGYVNQEICKLSFWETKTASNYLFVDSDATFIKDFGYSDFIVDINRPYSVLVMDKELRMEKFYKEFGKWREEMIEKIFNEVGLSDRRYLTCHGMTVMNERVLMSLKRDFMVPKGYSYLDLLQISPYEFTWYNAWLQKSRVIEILNVEPFFRTYHMRMEYLFSRLRMISKSDIATQYIGIVLNSNWKPKAPPDDYKDPGKIIGLFYNLLGKIL